MLSFVRTVNMFPGMREYMSTVTLDNFNRMSKYGAKLAGLPIINLF